MVKCVMKEFNVIFMLFCYGVLPSFAKMCLWKECIENGIIGPSTKRICIVEWKFSTFNISEEYAVNRVRGLLTHNCAYNLDFHVEIEIEWFHSNHFVSF